jgi:hypothetical protein
VLDTSSHSFDLAMMWVNLDPWLLLGGVLLVPFGLLVARLRPLAFALLIQVLMTMRDGYLPFPYVLGLLPFAAMLVGGLVDVRRSDLAVFARTARSLRRGWSVVAQRLTGPVADAWRLRLTRWRIETERYRQRLSGRAGLARAVAVALLGTVLLTVPMAGSRSWAATLTYQAGQDGGADSRAATEWVKQHVDRGDVVVTDTYVWLDLVLAGYDNTVWSWKLDLDPAVMAQMLPDGFASIDYLVLSPPDSITLDRLPTLRAAIESSVVVQSFGAIEIRRVTRAPDSP